MCLVTRSTPVIDSVPHTWTPPFKTLFFSCPRYQPYCCYEVESRARARKFSLPFVSVRYYRYIRTQPSSYFPLCPFYIYIYRCLQDRVATLRVFLRFTHRSTAPFWERNEDVQKMLRHSGLIQASLILECYLYINFMYK